MHMQGYGGAVAQAQRGQTAHRCGLPVRLPTASPMIERVGVEPDSMSTDDQPTDDQPTDDQKRTAHRALVTRVLQGDGRATQADRRAAFENAGLPEPLGTLIDKVAVQPTRITDEDVAAVKASGLSEDQIFELVICAALGQATRQYETALAALAEATAVLPDQTRSEHAAADPQ